MKYLVSLFDEKTGDNIYIFTFSPLQIGTEIQYGHDDAAVDGLRSWKVLNCSECPHGVKI